jgi:hypothetical protein
MYYSRYIRHKLVFFAQPWESFQAQTFLYEYNNWSFFVSRRITFFQYLKLSWILGFMGCIARMCQKFTSHMENTFMLMGAKHPVHQKKSG